MCVENSNMSALRVSLILHVPLFHIYLEKTVAPFNFYLSSSSVGITGLVLLMVELAAVMSIFILSFRSDLGVKTRLDIHSVGPWTPPMISSFSNSFKISSRGSLLANGIFLCAWILGVTAESMSSFIYLYL